MEWYLSLNINMRIQAKSCFVLLTGVEFDQLSSMFTLSEIIDILYNKLKQEGFDV